MIEPTVPSLLKADKIFSLAEESTNENSIEISEHILFLKMEMNSSDLAVLRELFHCFIRNFILLPSTCLILFVNLRTMPMPLVEIFTR